MSGSQPPVVGAPLDETRTVRRVAPLEEPFALTAAEARSSRLHGRMVFVTGTPADGHDVANRLAPSGSAAVASTGLFTGALDHIWAAFQRPSDVGLATLMTGREFLPALRRLADDLVGVQCDGVVVDAHPGYAEPDALAAITSVYPDALVVAPERVRDRLPAPLRDKVTPPTQMTDLPVPSTASSTDAAPTPTPTPLDGLRDRLIVIVGAGRSGTTWLQQLFLAHPDVAGAPESESWLFEQLALVWRRREALAIDQPAFITALRTYADTVFLAGRKHHRPMATFVVEKTPVHSYRLDEITAVYPDAWVIHLIRDGREVARSMAAVPFFELTDVAAAADVWARVLDAIRSAAPRVPRFREIRYESLRAHPTPTMQQIFTWVGLRDDESVRVTVEAAAGERVSAHAGTNVALGGEAWRNLPATDVAAIYRRIGGHLVRSGYARKSDVVLTRLTRGRRR